MVTHIIFIHLQTTFIQDNDDIDPAMKVHLSCAANINNCLSLPVLNTLGPANDVPRLARGIVNKYNNIITLAI